LGVAFPLMPHEFTDWEQEPEAQAGSSRRGGPPRKFTGVGVLDPPVPPKRQRGPLPPIPASWLIRILAAIILIGIVVGALLLLRYGSFK
jgi:hypothetical protein